MTFQIQLFVILLLAGLTLVGAEVFVPGGILGAMGAIALVLCIIVAFNAFGPVFGSYIAFAIIVLVGVAIVLWIRFFPKTSVGRKMTVSRDLASSKATDEELTELEGKYGRTVSDLRPSGFATIEGTRIDVISRGEMISAGVDIVVLEVEGNRVIVKEVTAPSG
ncbi:MAG: hypothetical protein HQ559_07780 [Lentisphaerae bacterium]|nr:hypothetical protein [Lentisphaerota bacterium]